MIDRVLEYVKDPTLGELVSVELVRVVEKRDVDLTLFDNKKCLVCSGDYRRGESVIVLCVHAVYEYPGNIPESSYFIGCDWLFWVHKKCLRELKFEKFK